MRSEQELMLRFLQFIEMIRYQHDDKNLYEMANMQPEDTGLLPIIHVMHVGKAKHGPRIKVSNINGRFHPDDNFTVTAEVEPRVIGDCKLKQEHLDDIIDWVKLNRDHIHHVWHDGDTMKPSEIENGFKKI